MYSIYITFTRVVFAIMFWCYSV